MRTFRCIVTATFLIAASPAFANPAILLAGACENSQQDPEARRCNISVQRTVGGGYRFSNGVTATPSVAGGFRFSNGLSVTPTVGGGYRFSDGRTAWPTVGGGFRLSDGTSIYPTVGGGFRVSR